jgi:hypothetical protein
MYNNNNLNKTNQMKFKLLKIIYHRQMQMQVSVMENLKKIFKII